MINMKGNDHWKSKNDKLCKKSEIDNFNVHVSWNGIQACFWNFLEFSKVLHAVWCLYSAVVSVHALFYFTGEGRKDVWGSLWVDMYMLKKLAQERRCKLVDTLDGHNWISCRKCYCRGQNEANPVFWLAPPIGKLVLSWRMFQQKYFLLAMW